jgi:hypothetical protein
VGERGGLVQGSRQRLRPGTVVLQQMKRHTLRRLDTHPW